MKTISLLDMLQAGVHFGHQQFRRNPKMDRYIHTTRNGLSIIDLQKTAEKLQAAFDFLVDITSRGGTVLLLGTKKQAADPLTKMAEEAGIPYVTHRWMGGMMTNWETIERRIARLRELEEWQTNGELEKYTKREQLTFTRELEKLKKEFGGIAQLNKLPDLIVVVGVNKEKIAINEAHRKGIPVIGLVDTNCDPEAVDFPIPANDDAVKSIELLIGGLIEGAKEGISRFEAASGQKSTAAKTEAKAVKAEEAAPKKKEKDDDKEEVAATK